MPSNYASTRLMKPERVVSGTEAARLHGMLSGLKYTGRFRNVYGSLGLGVSNCTTQESAYAKQVRSRSSRQNQPYREEKVP